MPFQNGNKLAKGGSRTESGPPRYLSKWSKYKNQHRAERMFNRSMLMFIRFLKHDPWADGESAYINERQAHYLEQCKYWINKYLPNATPEIFNLNFNQFQNSEILLLIREAAQRLESNGTSSATPSSGLKPSLKSGSTHGNGTLVKPSIELDVTPITENKSAEVSVTEGESPSSSPDSEAGRLEQIRKAAQ